MANTTNGGPQGAAGAANPLPNPESLPQVNVLSQYTKDFSFENPHAPRSLQPSDQPSINLQINVNQKQLSDTDFEVELTIEGKAEAKSEVIFQFELAYAGIFRLQNVPAEAVQPIMYIECPRLLFPFAREIVSAAVRNGGFPPLMLDPTDFAGLYRPRPPPGQASGGNG